MFSPTQVRRAERSALEPPPLARALLRYLDSRYLAGLRVVYDPLTNGHGRVEGATMASGAMQWLPITDLITEVEIQRDSDTLSHVERVLRDRFGVARPQNFAKDGSTDSLRASLALLPVEARQAFRMTNADFRVKYPAGQYAGPAVDWTAVDATLRGWFRTAASASEV